MLDCLHEDVNRVLTKPYVPGLEDEEIERMTMKQHGDDSWQRHLARNRYVLGADHEIYTRRFITALGWDGVICNML